MSLWLSDFFFFFKQKTAYEMRISDWSSDVCSSDLTGDRPSPWYSRNRCLHPELSLAAPYVFAPVGVSAGESITRGFPKYKGNADECMCAVRLGACGPRPGAPLQNRSSLAISWRCSRKLMTVPAGSSSAKERSPLADWRIGPSGTRPRLIMEIGRAHV